MVQDTLLFQLSILVKPRFQRFNICPEDQGGFNIPESRTPGRAVNAWQLSASSSPARSLCCGQAPPASSPASWQRRPVAPPRWAPRSRRRPPFGCLRPRTLPPRRPPGHLCWNPPPCSWQKVEFSISCCTSTPSGLTVLKS